MARGPQRPMKTEFGGEYGVLRRVVQRSSTLLELESPRMSLTRDALWHNGL